MLNKAVVWFAFTKFTIEVLVLLLFWPSGILHLKLSRIASVMQFLCCVEESSPAFLVKILMGVVWKGFSTAWGISYSFEHFHTFFFVSFYSVSIMCVRNYYPNKVVVSFKRDFASREFLIRLDKILNRLWYGIALNAWPSNIIVFPTKVKKASSGTEIVSSEVVLMPYKPI